MQLSLSRILAVVTMAVVAMVYTTQISFAQSAEDLQRAMLNGDESSAYGTNPYQNDEERPANLDDTTKKAKIRKPLESYFFSDSIRALKSVKWNVNRDLNEIKIQKVDTTLADWRIDYPYQKDGVGDMSLGGLGQATQPIDYFERPNYFNFSFSQAFDSYLYNMENAPFYNVKNPFTQMQYIESGSSSYREVNFEIIHAQSISPSTSFALSYKSPGTKGLYNRQKTKNHNLALTFSHLGKRYSLHGGYINNNITTQESGGVVGDWAVRDTTFELNIGIPMKLADAEALNQYRNNSVFIQQSYGIPLVPMSDLDFSMEQLPAVYFGHSFEYNQWTKKYTDVRATYTDDRYERDETTGEYVVYEGTYYDDWFINPDITCDSIAERIISNRLYIQAQPWDRNGVVGTLNGGIGIDFHTYSQFSLDNYLTSEQKRDQRTSYFFYGAVDGKIRNAVKWGGDFKLYPSGYRGGDMSLGGDIALTAKIAKQPITLSGSLRHDIQSPSYWEQTLFSNHYVWVNNFSAEQETKFEAKLSIPSWNFELAMTQSISTDKIYYNADCLPTQESESVSVTAIYAQKNFKVGGMNFDHRLLYQMSTHDSVVAVPDFSAYLSYYYEFWVVKDVLRLQLGADTRYTTSYYMPGYNPALSTFYNQREVEVGDYPYMDVYAAAKWKRMRIILKYQHINDGLFGNGDNFSVAHYPLNPGMFKFGISWGFYD
ncbi:MAG: putative porin [Rikenellaceae bacterium]